MMATTSMFLVFCIYGYLFCIYGYLHTEWKQINALIVRPDLSPTIRATLNRVIYKHYSPWALYQTIEFKKFHHYKCKHIPLEELHLYCLEGLQRGIERYDASSSFHNFIQYYLRGRLYKGMTELQPLSRVSIRNRMRKQTKSNKHMRTVFVGENEWMFDCSPTTTTTTTTTPLFEKNIQVWAFIHEKLDPKEKKIMAYKYDFDFNEMRSNKKVAELMVYSEENIRLQLHGIKNKINNHMAKY